MLKNGCLSTRYELWVFFVKSFYKTKNQIKNINYSTLSKNTSLLVMLLLLNIVFLSSVNTTYALSAVKANEIEGNPPFIILPNGTILDETDNWLYLYVPKQDGSEEMKKIEVNSEIVELTVSDGMKYSDIILLAPANHKVKDLPNLTVGDADRDANAFNGSFIDTMKAGWFNDDITVPRL